MESFDIKTALFHYFRVKKQHSYNAAECGEFNSDFLTVTKENELIEIEIKISLSDLKADFKKRKHAVYRDNKSIFTPHKFYFCVPEELEEDCKKLISENNKSYGIFIYRTTGQYKYTNWAGKEVESVVEYKLEEAIVQSKSAKKLHVDPLQKAVFGEIAHRMSNDLATKYKILLQKKSQKQLAVENKQYKENQKSLIDALKQYKECDRIGCVDCPFGGSISAVKDCFVRGKAKEALEKITHQNTN